VVITPCRSDWKAKYLATCIGSLWPRLRLLSP